MPRKDKPQTKAKATKPKPSPIPKVPGKNSKAGQSSNASSSSSSSSASGKRGELGHGKNVTQSAHSSTTLSGDADGFSITGDSLWTNDTVAGDLETDPKNIRDLLIPILEKAQDEAINKNELLKEAKQVYALCDYNTFARVLWRMMAHPFCLTEDQNNPYAKRMCVFFNRIVNEIEGGEELPTKFQRAIIRCCLKHWLDERKHMRERVTEVVIYILRKIGKNNISSIQYDTTRQIKQLFIKGLKDKHYKVRALCAGGLQYFIPLEYEPGLELIRVLEFSLRHDPSYEVRRAALLSMRFSTENDVLLFEKAIDKHEIVRQMAFVLIKRDNLLDAVGLTIRESIVKAGLTDESAQVKRLAREALLSFYDFCGKDILLLLSKFDVFTRRNVCMIIIPVIIRHIEDVREIDLSFLEHQVIPYEKLTPENAFLWAYLVSNYKTAIQTPNPTDMLEYMFNYAKYIEDKEEDILWPGLLNMLMTVFIKLQLEEGSRRKLQEWIYELAGLKSFDMWNVKMLISILHYSDPDNVEEFVAKLLQVFLDANIVEQRVINKLPKRQRTARKPRKAKKVKIDVLIRDLLIERGNLAFKRHKLISELDKATDNKDFQAAQKVKEEIEQLKQDHKNTQDKIEELESNRALAALETSVDLTSDTSSEVEESESSSDDSEVPADNGTIVEAPKTKYSSRGLSLAFSALFYHLKLKNIRKPSPYARAFFDQHFCSAFSGSESSAEVRVYALKAGTIFACANADEADLLFNYIVKALQFDMPFVANVAFQCLFDLVLLYGFDKFKDKTVQVALGRVVSRRESVSLENSLLDGLERSVQAGGSDREDLDHGSSTFQTSTNEKEGVSELQHLIIQQLSNRKVDPMITDTGVQGIIKLMIAKRLKAPKLLLPLLLIWINPENEGKSLKRDLGAFFPMYAKLGVEESLNIVKALKKCFNKISCAKVNNPLRDSSKEILLKFIANWTNPNVLKDLDKRYVPHELLAKNVVDLIEECNDVEEMDICGKSLKLIHLEGSSLETLTHLCELLPRIRRKSPQHIGVSLSHFRRYVEQLKADLDLALQANAQLHRSVGNENDTSGEEFSICEMEVTVLDPDGPEKSLENLSLDSD